MKAYNPHEIEPRLQLAWEEAGLYTVPENSDAPKKYVLETVSYTNLPTKGKNSQYKDVVDRFFADASGGDREIEALMWTTIGAMPVSYTHLRISGCSKIQKPAQTGRFPGVPFGYTQTGLFISVVFSIRSFR